MAGYWAVDAYGGRVDGYWAVDGYRGLVVAGHGAAWPAIGPWPALGPWPASGANICLPKKIKLKIFFVFALCFLQVLVCSVFLHHIFFNSENLRRLLHLITKIIKFTHKKKNNVGSSKKKKV